MMTRFLFSSLQAYQNMFGLTTYALRSLYVVEPTPSTPTLHMACFSDVPQLPPELQILNFFGLLTNKN